MNKTLFPLCFLTLFLLFGFNGFCQKDNLKWIEGENLKYSDLSTKDSINYIDVYLHYEYSFQPYYFRKITPIIIADAYLNKLTSGIIDSSNLNLKYAQIVFNLEGYASKQLKFRALNLKYTKSDISSYKEKIDSLFFQIRNETALLKKQFDTSLQSPNNKNVKVLDHWNEKVEHLIRETPTVIHENRPSNFGMGVNFGAGSNIFLGETKGYFTNSIGLNLGMEADYKKSRFEMNMNLGFNKSKSEYYSGDLWNLNDKTNLTYIDFAFGRIIPKDKWTFVPLIGLTINEITPRKNKDDPRKLTGYSPLIGWEMNRVIGSKADQNELTTFYYRLRLTVNPFNYLERIAGPQVNLSLSVALNSFLMRNKVKTTTHGSFKE